MNCVSGIKFKCKYNFSYGRKLTRVKLIKLIPVCRPFYCQKLDKFNYLQKYIGTFFGASNYPKEIFNNYKDETKNTYKGYNFN